MDTDGNNQQNLTDSPFLMTGFPHGPPMVDALHSLLIERET